jgi:RNA polymerase sigma-70 factor (ECF subfamily)
VNRKPSHQDPAAPDRDAIPALTATRPTDRELVRRAQSGGRDALVELYQRYVNEIYGYVWNQVGEPHDAEDLTSETFLRFVRSIDQFEARSSFRTWLYQIARNQLRDHWRRNGRRPVAELDLERLADETQPAPSDNPGATLLGRAILERLPDNYRQVLQLRILDGRSVRHTAEEMGKTETNVKVLTHRALKRAAELAEELVETHHENG